MSLPFVVCCIQIKMKELIFLSSKLETIELTVMKTTVEDLNYLSQTSQLSMGEVVDRLTARISTEDPELAHVLIAEDMIVLMSRLSQENAMKVMCDIAKELMMPFPPEQMDQLVAEAKEARKESQEMFSAMTPEERADHRNEFEDFLTFIRDNQRGPANAECEHSLPDGK